LRRRKSVPSSRGRKGLTSREGNSLKEQLKTRAGLRQRVCRIIPSSSRVKVESQLYRMAQRQRSLEPHTGSKKELKRTRDKRISLPGVSPDRGRRAAGRKTGKDRARNLWEAVKDCVPWRRGKKKGCRRDGKEKGG